MQLKDKVALVTGASSGIGECVSKMFAAEGAKVGVVASSKIERAQVVVDAIEQAGGTGKAFTANVTSTSSVASLIQQTEESLGKIDILVNCAGVFVPTPVGEMAEADIDNTVDINLKGTIHMINAVAPGMKERRSGKIVNISSIAGVIGIGTYGVYCATKAGIIYLTKSLACELAPFDINVNCIAPGNTATPINSDIRNDPEKKAVLDYMTALTPSNQIYSTPDDIAGAALFLSTKSGRAMHGSVMQLDEGICAGLFMK